MKKFFFRLCLFLAIFITIDLIIGVVVGYMRYNSKGGSTARYEFIAHYMESPLLVMGSSRALHHYSPVMLADSLGLDCYNCGLDGNGIIYNYGMLNLITQRYTPKLIIYDLIPSFDIKTGEPNNKYLTQLRPYYTNGSIKDIICEIDPTSRIKMLSKMYAANRNIIQVSSDFVFPRRLYNAGFEPISGTINYEPMPSASVSSEIDSVKVAYFNRFFNLCAQKGIELVITISPWYFETSLDYYEPIWNMARQRNITTFDFTANPLFLHNKQLFYDSGHLNDNGARIFTSLLIDSLKTIR